MKLDVRVRTALSSLCLALGHRILKAGCFDRPPHKGSSRGAAIVRLLCGPVFDTAGAGT